MASTTAKPSFLRGVFAGQIHDALLFPYPAPLDERGLLEWLRLLEH